MSNKGWKHTGLEGRWRRAARVLRTTKTPRFSIAWAETKVETSCAILLTALLIVVAWFTQTTFNLKSSGPESTGAWRALTGLGISSTLTVLRVLQSVLTTSTSFAILNSLNIISWVLTKRDAGVRTLLLLGLSSSTDIWGVLGLIFSRHVKFQERSVAAAKIILLCMTWASGILLFARTQLVQVNRTYSTYNVTGGVGIFRGSYVAEYLGRLQEMNPGYNSVILPYSVIVAASQLVVNPAYSLSTTPVATCPDEKRCESYLLPGGLLTSTPWPPTDHKDYPTITIYHAPATQIDFVRVTEQEEVFIDADDCVVYGSQQFSFGIQFCLVESQQHSGSLLAGVFICEDGLQNGECQTSVNPPKLVTLLTVYQRRVTTTCARSNMSILAVRDLSDPVQQVQLNVSALKQSFTWLFNSSAADIPLPSSPAQYFWTAQKQLGNEYWLAELYRLFHSLLAFPFWHFNDNNYGNIRLDSETITTSLPAEFSTYAAIDQPVTKISVDRGMFIAFCILQSVCIAFVWGALFSRWIYYFDMPNISSYPVIDFAMKTHQNDNKVVNMMSDEGSINESFERLITPASGNTAIRRRLRDNITIMRSKKQMDSNLEAERWTVAGGEASETDQQTLYPNTSQQALELTQRLVVPEAGHISDRQIRRKPVPIDPS